MAAPKPYLTAITLGVAAMARSVRFYDALGFDRRMRKTGEEVAPFEVGGVILALYPWDRLAADAMLPDQPRPQTFRGMTLAWNHASLGEVDAEMEQELAAGATLIRPAGSTHYGGYRGYCADPDGHPWEVVCAPGFLVRNDGRVSLPD